MANIKEDLKKAESLNDIFNIINLKYDTTKKMGIITKTVIIQNIDKLISASGIKLKP